MKSDVIAQKLSLLPDRPGVYLMKKGARIIYIGKAKILRSRVRSYFQKADSLDPKTAVLVPQITDLEWIITDSELEALILEASLVRTHRPQYNIRLKDDKRFPYLMLTTAEPYPRLEITRQPVRNHAKYFGPYTNPPAMRRVKDLIHRIFKVRECREKFETKPLAKPCLSYQIGRCLAPCVRYITEAEYRAAVDNTILFLRGRRSVLEGRLQQQMEAAARDLEFERAGRLRDQLQSLAATAGRQKIFSGDLGDRDLLAHARHGNQAVVVIFRVREGLMTGQSHFFLSVSEFDTPADILGSFLAQSYAEGEDIPPEILLDTEPADAETLARWLGQVRCGSLALKFPQKGEKFKTLALCRQNAEMLLAQRLELGSSRKTPELVDLEILQKDLNLPRAPQRIEGYDVSHLQGKNIVASRVVFTGGKPDKDQYRRYRIKTLSGADDTGAIREVLQRRLDRLVAENEAWPNLILIDGGQGQLNAAVEVLARYPGSAATAVLGLAKRLEEIYLPGEPEVRVLPRRSRSLRLLQRLRDEAHRFAVAYHRTLRKKALTASVLDGLPGLGPQRKKSLLMEWGSVKALRAASAQEITGRGKLAPELAQAVVEKLAAGRV
jgi:excinuclease ABC subunit C